MGIILELYSICSTFANHCPWSCPIAGRSEDWANWQCKWQPISWWLCLCNFAICLGQIRHRSDPLRLSWCCNSHWEIRQLPIIWYKGQQNAEYPQAYCHIGVYGHRCVKTPSPSGDFKEQPTKGPCCQTIAGHRQRFSLQPGPRLRSRMVMLSSTPWQHLGTSRATSAESMDGRHGLTVFSGSEKSKDFILGWNLGIPPRSLSIQLLFKSLTQVSPTSMTRSWHRLFSKWIHELAASKTWIFYICNDDARKLWVSVSRIWSKCQPHS